MKPLPALAWQWAPQGQQAAIVSGGTIILLSPMQLHSSLSLLPPNGEPVQLQVVCFLHFGWFKGTLGSFQSKEIFCNTIKWSSG